ncbi:MAG TPA: hypothetical protein VH092_22255, partial [Urbifossiella sp.]|nr:hypothetical protein [Urbifossiella sp.]
MSGRDRPRSPAATVPRPANPYTILAHFPDPGRFPMRPLIAFLTAAFALAAAGPTAPAQPGT